MAKAKQSEGHHEELMGGFLDQLRVVFDSSQQPMYLYLDDAHKACNQKLASLLGYGTPREWARVDDFSDLVAEKNMTGLVSAYQAAMDRKIGSTVEVTWRTKSGGTVNTTVILVPVAYKEHLFALHFVSPKA